LDAATQAAIQAAAEAAARAAIAAQQQRQAAAAMAGPHAGGLAAAGIAGLPQGSGMSNFVKVSGESDPRKVAGKLAHTCRDNPAPAMLTIGTKCINQAVKAICIARGEPSSCLACIYHQQCCQGYAGWCMQAAGCRSGCTMLPLLLAWLQRYLVLNEESSYACMVICQLLLGSSSLMYSMHLYGCAAAARACLPDANVRTAGQQLDSMCPPAPCSTAVCTHSCSHTK
jgi:hypothetical protein